ncbi:MAG: hypothetical protein JO211_06875 [Acidobacteriaceae bacterium]|nr:hypothetical protein [Acidobacteriaceae bacterium]
MLGRWAICLTTVLTAGCLCLAQETQAGTTKAMLRITGTVTAADPATHSVTVKEDKTGTEYTVQLANARTLLKVAPGAKDLTGATRITADDLAPGDRVQIGSSQAPVGGTTIEARSVLLMSARDLQQLHQQQAAAWQHSTAGVVTAVDTATHKLQVTARTVEGPKPMVVDVANAQFTRYSPETPQAPVPSQVIDIQPGDQVRMIGDKNEDGTALTAQKVYSSSFRTVVGTVSSVAADGKELTIKNLQNKQALTVTLNDDSAVRKLPPMLAMGLARRFNPDLRAAQAGAGANNGNGSGTPGSDASQPGGQGPAAAGTGAAGAGGPGGPGRGMRAGNGDLSQLLERLPKMSATDLKPGDAVVVSGSPQSADKSHLLATNVIAGVEPIFQSASPRQAQSLGDWGASLGAGGMDTGGMPGAPPQ